MRPPAESRGQVLRQIEHALDHQGPTRRPMFVAGDLNTQMSAPRDDQEEEIVDLPQGLWQTQQVHPVPIE